METKQPDVGRPGAPVETTRGVDLLYSPQLNKGNAFSDRERDALGLRGLLPPRVLSLEQQVAGVLENLARKPTDLEKYIALANLQDSNETLFYRVLLDHLVQLMPIVYTPTVGEACRVYGEIYRRPRGLYISERDRGRVASVLENWPQDGVRMIVVTDGERILGLGDLGANGMGIPIGKLTLCTAIAGVNPAVALPITLDVGTDNAELKSDPLYLGSQQRRLSGEAYYDFVEEFVVAVQERFPGSLLQFEDFGNANAFRLLEKYRDRICTFNDDIQGTAAVVLAGLKSSMRLIEGALEEQRVLFLGAGAAAIGTANLLVTALVEEGLSLAEARRRCWLFDSKGLVVAGRAHLSQQKLAYAHEHASLKSFATAVDSLRPTAIIGVSGQPGHFTRPVIEAMSRINERPIIFALSNPTSLSECTAEEAFSWSAGQAIFASGSPFPPVVYQGRTLLAAQCNNAYIFPGLSLAVVAVGARRVTDQMFMAAAAALAEQVSNQDLAQGRIFPDLGESRRVSAEIATAVAGVCYDQGVATVLPRPEALLPFIRSQMVEASYQDPVQGDG